MSNNDKFIRDTEFGKLMESETSYNSCDKCKYFDNEPESSICGVITKFLCIEGKDYYFAKDEPNETEKV